MRQKMLLLGAVLFGLLAFALTYRQIEAQKREIMGTAETAVLIRLTKNKTVGDILADGDLERYEIRRPRGGGQSREIPWSEVSRVYGRTLETSMTQGQLLLNTDLKPVSQRQGFSGAVRAQWRAISIPVDPVSSVTNLIQPNDNVDIIGTFRFPDVRGDTALDTVTLTILQDVKVLAVGNRWGPYALDPTGGRSYSTVTVQLLPEEVEMIIFASQKGKLSLSLRNYEDKVIDLGGEARSINFKYLEKEIPRLNRERERKRNI